MKHASSERRVNSGIFEYRCEVRHSARAAGCNEWYVANLPHRAQLLDVVTPPHAVTPHAVENDLSAASFLYFPHPGEDFATGLAGTVRISRELVSPVALACKLTVNPNNHTLRAETRAQGIDQPRIRQRRRINGNLLGTRVQDLLGVRHRPNSAGHTKRNVEHPRNAPYPLTIDRAPLRARGDVIKD